MTQLCPRGVIEGPLHQTFRLFIPSLMELSELAGNEKSSSSWASLSDRRDLVVMTFLPNFPWWIVVEYWSLKIADRSPTGENWSMTLMISRLSLQNSSANSKIFRLWYSQHLKVLPFFWFYPSNKNGDRSRRFIIWIRPERDIIQLWPYDRVVIMNIYAQSQGVCCIFGASVAIKYMSTL